MGERFRAAASYSTRSGQGKKRTESDSFTGALAMRCRFGKGAEAALEITTSFSQGTYSKELKCLSGTRDYGGACNDAIAAADLR